MVYIFCRLFPPYLNIMDVEIKVALPLVGIATAIVSRTGASRHLQRAPVYFYKFITTGDITAFRFGERA